MAKTLHYADDARKGLFAGIEAVANAVKVTMGPKGRNVILERTYGGPIVTNDGVTTSTVVLSHAMAKEGLRYIRSGVNPFSLGKGLHKTVELLTHHIAQNAQQI